MIKEVYEAPSSVLGRQMPEVKVYGPFIYNVLTDLRDTMFETGGVGMAANQLGYELRICVIRLGDGNRVLEMVNPTILSRRGRIYSSEACLSIPKYVAIIPRSSDVKVGFKTRDGKVAMMTLANNSAIRAQHEIDHLNGILIWDYVEGRKGKSGGIDATAGSLEIKEEA